MRRGPGALAAIAVCAACGAGERDAAPARFAVRGRWPGPPTLTWRSEDAHTPLAAGDFARAVARAAAAWNATGVVTLQPAADGQPADVTLGWRRGHHGACEPFGPSADVAHAGPVAPGTFVHFDLARAWSADGEAGLSVFATALHELGHVLGLGHSDAIDAVMGTDPTRPAALSRHDLAGLWSLYGDGSDGPGDLHVVRADGTAGPILRRVAPESECGFAVFDSDGDGDAEVLVWRTDPAGAGELTAFHFAPGPLLARTTGPFPGTVIPGARTGFVAGPGGERLIVCTPAGGEPRAVRQFDGHGVPGLPGLPGAAAPAAALARAGTPGTGDLDGDGTPETVACARR